MSLREEADLLRRIPLFAGIEPARLKLLAFASERITFEPGHYLFRHGDPGDAAYIIIDGEADVLIDTPSGPRLVASVGRNDLIGEVAILCDVPRTAGVRARGHVVTLRIAKELFMRLLAEFPQMAVAMLAVLAHRLENTTAQLRIALAAGKT